MATKRTKKKTARKKATKKKAVRKKAKAVRKRQAKKARSSKNGTNPKTRAEQMAHFRDEKGWTYERIAEKFGVSRQRVHQVLSESDDKGKPPEPGEPRRELLRGRGIQRKLEQYTSPQTLGDRIVYLRLKRGWTIGELSHESGIPYGVLSTYENNNAKPSCDNLMKLSTALRVSAHWFLFGHGFKKSQA